MSSTTTEKSTTTKTYRWAQTRPAVITGLLVAATIGCGVASLHWAPLQSINHRAADLASGDAVGVTMGIASVAAIGAGFAGVVVAYAISSERPTVVEFRSMVGPLLKANWLSVIGCSFSAALLALLGGALFAMEAATWAAWVSIAAVALLLHSIARNMYLFLVFLDVIAIGDERDKRAAAVVPIESVITKRKTSL